MPGARRNGPVLATGPGRRASLSAPAFRVTVLARSGVRSARARDSSPESGAAHAGGRRRLREHGDQGRVLRLSDSDQVTVTGDGPGPPGSCV